MLRTFNIIFVFYVTFNLSLNISDGLDDKKTSNTITNVATITSTNSILAIQRNNSVLDNNHEQISGIDQHVRNGDQQIMMEGGSIKPSSIFVSTLVKNELKKPSYKIVPRKGVISHRYFNSTTNSFVEILNTSTVNTSQTNTPERKLTEKEETINNNTMVKVTTTESINNKTKFQEPKVHTNDTINKIASTTVTFKKHKPKPTVTVGESEDDKPIHSSSSPSIGKRKKIDYIVPVIIAIVILPLLIVILYTLYRRGRDCWDKRHYRRMDFLIDGMYNE